MSIVYSYFKKNHNEKYLKEFFDSRGHKSSDSIKIKNYLSEFNEFQFTQLVMDLLSEIPLHSIDFEKLKLLFIKNDYYLFEDPKFIFSYDSNFIPFKQEVHDYLKFNCSKELIDFVDYLKSTDELVKEAHIQKLRSFSTNIKHNFFQQIESIKAIIEFHLNDNSINIEGSQIYFYLCVIEAFNEFEQKLLLALDQIEERIEDLCEVQSEMVKNNFNISVKEEKLKRIYRELERCEFINLNEICENGFLKVFKCDWDSHEEILNLNMDNLQFYCFVDCLNKFFNIKIPFTTIEISKKIKNKNGFINAKSIYASKSRGQMLPKDEDLITNSLLSAKKG
ncbi:hypothetical protein V8G61_08840 [Gaetbulibacter sp. M240]|uniref:hypothetical protein n=1 Tax=Gaetbulibacter sp. M240 TaxID=3126511 RepID=UPI00374E65D1